MKSQEFLHDKKNKKNKKLQFIAQVQNWLLLKSIENEPFILTLLAS